MTSLLSLIALCAPIAFFTIALLAWFRPEAADAIRRDAARASWVALGAAAGAAVLVVREGVAESGLVGVEGLGLSIRLDSVSVIMLGMIALLAVVIVRYSNTYLAGDDRQGVFLGRLALTIASVQLLVIAGNLGLLVLAWVGTSLSLHHLLVFHPERRRAVIAARKKFVSARLGDAFLVAAAALLYDRFATGDLGVIFEGAASALGQGAFGTVEVAAICLAVAALLKSAQFPLHGWLVEVMETPTPVSALLHAGVLNAGPFLVIRMAQVMDGGAVANGMLLAVGGFTAMFASVALLTQPTVKVSLGYSSAAHMGFSLFVCAIGLYPAAFLHLVGHSFYKAHAFLSSGSAIDEARAGKPALPGRQNRPLRLAGAGLVATALYAGFAIGGGVDVVREPELLLLGLVLVLGLAQLLAAAFDGSEAAGALRAAGLALGVTAVFFTLEAAMHHLVKGVVPDITGRGPILLAMAAIVVAAFAAVVTWQILEPARTPSRRRQALAVHLRNGLYANAALDRVVGALRSTPHRSAASR